jgi:phosphohistidine phosphatase
MKRIVIVRHAKAEEHKLGLNDKERSLTDRGRKNASTIAIRLIMNNIQAGQFISSPAKRAFETARIYAREFSYDKKNILLYPFLYDNYSIDEIKGIIKKDNIQSDSIFLFGHNPTLVELAFDLTGKFNEHLPTSGTIVIDFDITDWNELKNRSGKIVLFEHPKK